MPTKRGGLVDLSGAASSFWNGTQRSFRGAFYLIALLVLMGPIEANASSVLVDASDGKTLAALEAAGSATIADRGSYRVLSLPNEAARNVASAAGLSPRADFDAIHLKRATVDTKSVRRTSLSDQRRLKLVQFAAPPTDAELDEHRATGAEIVQYVPQNAYLVWTTNEPTARALSKRAGPFESEPLVKRRASTFEGNVILHKNRPLSKEGIGPFH